MMMCENLGAEIYIATKAAEKISAVSSEEQSVPLKLTHLNLNTALKNTSPMLETFADSLLKGVWLIINLPQLCVLKFKRLHMKLCCNSSPEK